MDANMIMQLIGSYGFPVVACIAMGWYVKYTTDKNREEITNMTEQHKKEMAEVTTALNNNTIAIEKLCVMISERGDK